MDRDYQSHKLFDTWQADEKHFICRIKASTKKTIIRTNDIQPDSIVFYNAVGLLGTKGINRTEKEVCPVGYRVAGVDYWVATDRHDQHHEKVSVKRLRGISINIRNEMRFEDIVNYTGVWIYQPPNQDQAYASF